MIYCKEIELGIKHLNKRNKALGIMDSWLIKIMIKM